MTLLTGMVARRRTAQLDDDDWPPPPRRRPAHSNGKRFQRLHTGIELIMDEDMEEGVAPVSRGTNGAAAAARRGFGREPARRERRPRLVPAGRERRKGLTGAEEVHVLAAGGGRGAVGETQL
jgi:hypothetical protein